MRIGTRYAFKHLILRQVSESPWSDLLKSHLDLFNETSGVYAHLVSVNTFFFSELEFITIMSYFF